MDEYSVTECVEALRHMNVSEHHIRMAAIHYSYPSKDITATQLSKEMGYAHYKVANLHYGRFGRNLGSQLNIKELPKHPLNVIVEFEHRGNEWHWVMRENFAKAVEVLGWVRKTTSSFAYPEEVSESQRYSEGATKKINVNAYERSSKAREACITHYGYSCSVCDLSMKNIYGEIGESYIHVHHINPVSVVGEGNQIDPIKELRPVCPNCHSMLHRKSPPLSISELREIVANTKLKSR